MSLKTTLAACCAAALLALPAHSHELKDNRATLVLREPTHLAVTLFVDLPDVLQRVLAPNVSHTEFLLACAAQTPQEFAQLMASTQAKLQAQTRVQINGAAQTPLAQWVWPSAARVHQQIRDEVMGLVAGPASGTHAHAHEAPTELRASITHDAAIANAQITFAGAFGKVLVVSYRPRQVWALPDAATPPIEF